LGQKKTKIFLQKGLDRQISDLPLGSRRRQSRHPDEVRALARLEGWPQSTTLNNIFRGAPKTARTSG
jgi:hypothetical protein